MKPLLAFLFACHLVFSTTAFATPPESKEPIKMIINDWMSQILLAYITGQVYGKMGYQVVYAQSPSLDQWGAIGRGGMHVQVEVWEGTMSDKLRRLLDRGKVVDAGNHQATSREDWWYPNYVKELCPGLPDWRALNDCKTLFAAGKNQPQGIYYTGPWEKHDLDRVHALGLEYRVVTLDDVKQLFATLRAAYDRKQPIMIYNWTPNWILTQIKGEFVEFPEYEPACTTDPAWGTNKERLYDCGNPKQGWLKKIAWAGMPDKWPCAYQTLEKISFTGRMIAELSRRVLVDGLSHEQAARAWVTENEAVWRDWIPPHCRAGH